MISYLEGIEIILTAYVIMAFGYLLCALKKYDLERSAAIRKIISLTALPGLFFYQIGNQPMNGTVWSPFVVSLIVIVITHLILLLIVFLYPFQDKFNSFIQAVYGCCHISFINTGFPIMEILFPNYLWVSAMCGLCQNFILIPFHAALSFKKEKMIILTIN